MRQVVRLVTAADDGLLARHRLLICDRDDKWSRAVRQQFSDAGIRVILTPEWAPNANAYAERFVRSIKEECLERIIPRGSAISDARSQSSWSTTMASEITKDSAIP
jgi:putative transposase